MMKQMLFAALLTCSSAGYCNEDRAAVGQPEDSTPDGEMVMVIGTATYKGVSDYEPADCPVNGVCLHAPEWQIYEIEGYVLPGRDEYETLQVAQRSGSPIITSAPWLATLKKIVPSGLASKIGAEYFLVRAKSGLNVFCPDGDSEHLFERWTPDVRMNGRDCFSF